MVNIIPVLGILLIAITNQTISMFFSLTIQRLRQHLQYHIILLFCYIWIHTLEYGALAFSGIYYKEF